MKKALIVACCAIVLCSLLSVQVLLKPATPASQDNPQTTPQTTLQPTLPPTSGAPSQSTPQNTPQPTFSSTEQPSNRSFSVGVEKAIKYMAQTQEPSALLMLDVLYRRFGIAEFKDSLQRYDNLLASTPQDAMMRLLRRIGDYSNPVQSADFNAITEATDRITIPALYADRMSLPDNYPSILNDAKNNGGYMLTHALLATIWLKENNCTVSMPDNFMETLYYECVALTRNGLPVTDLDLEAAAFLHLAGQGTIVDDSFVQSVMATQNSDGGWSGSSDKPGISYWHASVLGLMILLHEECPAGTYPSMLASPTV